nr:zinc finger MYM-type protein 1-like [Setaria viridis]
MAHRVMRQFGRMQPCPPLELSTSQQLHSIDRRKRYKENDWRLKHGQYLLLWQNKQGCDPEGGPYWRPNNEYIRWYCTSTRTKVKPSWTNVPIEDAPFEDDADIADAYDTVTRYGTQPERAPLHDYMGQQLARLSNEAGVIMEHAVGEGFLDVNDTTGQGLFDVLENELKLLGLDIDDVRGQGYDNGSNMKGKHKGVKKKLLDVNPRAFYSACGCHSLNLTLCDMAKTCGKAKDFFGIIQRIYTTFANSTRWESRVESVKAIRFQCTDIREALLQVSDVDNDPKTSSEAKGLANNELGEYEFIVAIVIWYEVLYAINLVSKHLQAKDMLIDVAIEKVEGLISFFKGYRETGFSEALEIAKGIAFEMDIALESGLLEKIDYEHIIEDFISRNTKRIKYFN